jgi:hypothetical protein
MLWDQLLVNICATNLAAKWTAGLGLGRIGTGMLTKSRFRPRQAAGLTCGRDLSIQL